MIDKITFLIKHVRRIRTVLHLNAALAELSKDFTEPVRPTPLELEAFYESIRNRKDISNQFFLVEGLKEEYEVIPFHWNTETLLDFRPPLTDTQFVGMFHPKYLPDILQWALAGYICTVAYKHLILWQSHYYRITFPMKLKDGKYHWVQLHSTPLTYDKDGNLTTFFDTVTILSRPFIEKEEAPIMADITANVFPDEELTREIRRMKFTIHPFYLTKSQLKIARIKRQNLSLTNAEIAEMLGKDKDTVDGQNKQILARLKESFPLRFPPDKKYTLSEGIQFLEEVGYFDLLDREA